MATQDEYKAKAQEALTKLQTQLGELRVQADLAQAEARDRFQKAIDALRAQQRDVQARLDEAGKAGAGAWKSAAGQVEEAVDGLGDALSKLADEMQSAAGAGGSAAKQAFSSFLDEWKKQRAEREKLLKQ